jgi:hypothetical protein
MKVSMGVQNKETKEVTFKEYGTFMDISIRICISVFLCVFIYGYMYKDDLHINMNTYVFTYINIYIVVDKDECNRPQTTIEDLQKLKPVRFDIDPTATITAGMYV